MPVPERPSWWTECFVGHVNTAIINALPDEQQDDLCKELRTHPQGGRNLQEHLQYIRSLGYHVDELQAFLAVFDCFGVEEHSHKFLLWLASEHLPRFQQSMDRLDALESIIREFYERTTTLVDELSTSVTINDSGFSVSDVEGTRQHRVALSAQKIFFALGCDSMTPATNLEISAETRYTTLRSRVDSLEQSLKESCDGMENYQPVTQGEELAARGQALESKMEEIQPAWSDMTETIGSLSGTFTPASTDMNEMSDVQHNDNLPVSPLTLRVLVCTLPKVRFSQIGRPTETILVRMNPDTQFKALINRLRDDHGNLELRLMNEPHTNIFESDTPASLGLRDKARLAFASFYNGVKTMDLTMT